VSTENRSKGSGEPAQWIYTHIVDEELEKALKSFRQPHEVAA
jgi:hypothetical protein